MKTLLLSTILLFTVNLNAQSIDVLENKNGYKSLKINSQKSNYNYNLELIENKNGYTSYKYVDAYDKSLFNLFGNKINSINLTFENKSNKLKKIALNLNETKSLQWMNLLGYNLKELYTEFENIIGQTTEYPKPTSDCYQFKSESCLYFEDRALKGKILWKSPSVVLEIYQNVETKVNYNGTMNLTVNRTISFQDRSYFEDNKMSGF